MTSKRLLLAGLAWFVGPAPSVSAQKFEVAVIKPGSSTISCFTRMSGTELSLTDCTLLGWVKLAWGLAPYRTVINNGQPWVATEIFSIRAKAPLPLKRLADFKPMLGQLLEDQFGLVWHKEKRESPVFVLSVRKGAAPSKPSGPGTCTPHDSSAPPDPSNPNPCGAMTRYTPDGAGILMDGRSIHPSDFIPQLSMFLRREVVDATGLTGVYDISLHFARDMSFGMTGPPVLPAAPEFSDYPTMFTAIRSHGMELKAGKAPVEVFIIDRAHKPPDN